MSEERYMLTANEVATKLGIRISYAYKLIRQWNEELAAQGKLTIRGKINRKYFERKLEV